MDNIPNEICLYKNVEEIETSFIKHIITDTDEELDFCRRMLRISKRYCPSLNFLDIEYSDKQDIYIFENIIKHSSSLNSWETCVIKKKIQNGMHRLTFRRLGTSPIDFGIIQTNENCPLSYKSIMDDHFKGIGIRIEDNIGFAIVNKFKTLETIVSMSGGSTAITESESTIPLKGFVNGVGLNVKNKTINKMIYNCYTKSEKGDMVLCPLKLKNDDELTLEIDFRSDDPKERIMNFYVNGIQCPFKFTNLLNDFNFVVSLYEKNSSTEFLLLEEMDDNF